VAWHSTRVIARVPNTTKTVVQLEYSFSTQIPGIVVFPLVLLLRMSPNKSRWAVDAS